MKEKTEVKKLKELAEVISGVSIPTKFRFKKGKWQLIRGRDIIENTVVESETFIPENLAKKFIKAAIVPGDILLSIIFGQYKVGVVPLVFSPSIADRGILIIRPKLINKEYLHKFLVSNTGRSALIGQLAKMVRGDVIKFVTTKDVAELNIPLLPKNLQVLHQPVSPVSSRINQLKASFERQIVENISQFLVEKGWGKNQISLEYPISLGLRADIVIKQAGKPKILIEVKKEIKKSSGAQNQIIAMMKTAGIKEAYLVSGEGIKKIQRTGSVEVVTDLPSPKKE